MKCWEALTLKLPPNSFPSKKDVTFLSPPGRNEVTALTTSTSFSLEGAQRPGGLTLLQAHIHFTADLACNLPPWEVDICLVGKFTTHFRTYFRCATHLGSILVVGLRCNHWGYEIWIFTHGQTSTKSVRPLRQGPSQRSHRLGSESAIRLLSREKLSPQKPKTILRHPTCSFFLVREKNARTPQKTLAPRKTLDQIPSSIQRTAGIVAFFEFALVCGYLRSFCGYLRSFCTSNSARSFRQFSD